MPLAQSLRGSRHAIFQRQRYSPGQTLRHPAGVAYQDAKKVHSKPYESGYLLSGARTHQLVVLVHTLGGGRRSLMTMLRGSVIFYEFGTTLRSSACASLQVSER